MALKSLKIDQLFAKRHILVLRLSLPLVKGLVVVLTGGPCGGKSTALGRLRDMVRLIQKNWGATKCTLADVTEMMDHCAPSNMNHMLPFARKVYQTYLNLLGRCAENFGLNQG